jgi:hypothetical protein
VSTMKNLVTIVRPHICAWNAEEIRSADCQWGCKVFRCSKCGTTAVVHNATYGCRKAK